MTFNEILFSCMEDLNLTFDENSIICRKEIETHTHTFTSTVVNDFGLAVERGCACGRVEWHHLGHVDKESGWIDWQPGFHPHRGAFAKRRELN